MAVPTRASSAGRRGRPSAVGLRYPAGRLGPGSVAMSVLEALLARATITDLEAGNIHVPASSDVLDRLDAVEEGQVNGFVPYVTKAEMNADLSPADKTIALVARDPVESNNGTYQKSGASGSGSWLPTVDRIAALEARRNALLASTSEYALSGYGGVTIDAAGKVLQGFRTDGKYEVLGRLPLAEIDDINVDITDLRTNGNDLLSRDKSYDLSGYKSATVDANGKVLSGFTQADEYELLGRKPLAELDRLLPVAPTQPEGYEQSGWRYAITDDDGKISFGVTPDGEVVIPNIILPNLITAPAILTILRNERVLPSRDIVWWGDSLTANISDSVVATYFPDRSVIRRGFGGQTSTLIAARNGGRPIYLTLLGNTLPGSGTVAITAKSPDPFLSTTVAGDTCDGRLLNVPVRISQDGSGNYTLTRLVAGPTRYVMPGALFVPNNDYTDRTHILWLGRNNYSDPDAVLQDTIYCVNRIATSTKRFLVLSVLNGEYDNERAGGGGYNQIMQCNKLLEQTFPDNYVDIRRILVESYDAGSPDDVTDYGYDQTPSSKRLDNIHLDDDGNSVALSTLADNLDERSW